MPNKYPLWKYILLIVVIAFGVIYSLPNLYGDNPALQISGKHGAQVTPALLNKVKAALQQAKLNYLAVDQNKQNLALIRFADTDTQFKARDYVKAVLGNDYTVAANLATAAPHWLAAMGAVPMKLGLDLRGGVHSLLAVDVNSVVKKRVQSMLREIGRSLREKRIRYSGLQRIPSGVLIRFRNEAALDKAYGEISAHYPNLRLQKSTANNQFLIKGILTHQALVKMRQTVMEQTMTVLRNRVNELGVAEPIVQQQGQDRVVVDLPGVQDAAQVQQILGGTATLEFHMVDDVHDVETALNGQIPMGSSLFHFKDGRPILLKNQVLLTGANINSATSTFGQQGPTVNISVSGSEVSYFNKMTARNVGKRMAIVFVETRNTTKLVKGKLKHIAKQVKYVISAPRIDSALGNNFQITGLTDQQEARNLSLLLRAGVMPANIYSIAQRLVGPSLGKENIHKGIVSVEIGFIFIVIFMLIYYHFFGFAADLALFLNLVLIIGILSLIGATLTLPGIAGIVLTVGMAVDANVLINERIREELRNGMSPLAAINAGYERALPTIVDSNVTTLIAAVVLMALGSGSIKGFAITLIIGLLTSMFTAITGTRAVVNLMYGRRIKVDRIAVGMPKLKTN